MTRRFTPEPLDRPRARRLCVSLPGLGWSASPEVHARPGHREVQAGHRPTGARTSLRAQLGGPRLRDLGIINGELVKITGPERREGGRAGEAQIPNVEYAEPDYELDIDVIPNDTRFNELYAMRNTGQTGGTAGRRHPRHERLGRLHRRSRTCKVGVIDTGVDYNHPDLAANVWTNPARFPATASTTTTTATSTTSTATTSSTATAIRWTTTATARTAPARSPASATTASASPASTGSAKIVGIKFLNAAGSGSTAGAIAGVQYAIAGGRATHEQLVGRRRFSTGAARRHQRRRRRRPAVHRRGRQQRLQHRRRTPFYPGELRRRRTSSRWRPPTHNDHLASFSNFGPTQRRSRRRPASTSCPACRAAATSCSPAPRWRHRTSPASVGARLRALPGHHERRGQESASCRSSTPIPALAGRCVTRARLNRARAISDPDNIRARRRSRDLATTNPGSTTDGPDLDGRPATTAAPAAPAHRAALLDGADRRQQLRQRDARSEPRSSDLRHGAGRRGQRPRVLARCTTSRCGRFDEWDNGGTDLERGERHDARRAGDHDVASLTPGRRCSTGQQAHQHAQHRQHRRRDARLHDPAAGAAVQDGFTAAAVRASADARRGKDAASIRASAIRSWPAPRRPGRRRLSLDRQRRRSAARRSAGWTSPASARRSAHRRRRRTRGRTAIGSQLPVLRRTVQLGRRVCTNGWLSFTSASTQLHEPAAAEPAAPRPENLVAPLWDDLDFCAASATPTTTTTAAGSSSRGSAARTTQATVRRGPYTFEAILYPSGEIRYQYPRWHRADEQLGRPSASRTPPATIGLQTAFNAERTSTTTWRCAS